MGDVDARELGERVRLARRRKGLTQDDLAQSVGLDRTAINKLETGVRKISALELSDIARVLGVRMSSFFEDETPAVIAHRSSEGLDTAQSSIDALLQEIASEVEFVQGLGTLEVEAPAKHRSAPRSADDAEQMAQHARGLLKAAPGEPLKDISRRVEALGLLVFARELGPDTADAGTVALRRGAVALVNSSMKVGRRRLAVAHELAHHLVGDPYKVDWRLESDDLAVESRFDRFARALLLPADRLGELWAGEENRSGVRGAAVILGSQFQVDMATLARRLVELDLVTPSIGGDVRSVRTTRADLIEYDLHAGDELAGDLQPRRYQQAVLELMRTDRISTERGLELLWNQISEEDLPKPRLGEENEIWQFVS